MTSVPTLDRERVSPNTIVEPGPAAAGGIASHAAMCLRLELETWPKPGLVSHVDSGSHQDMDADTFRNSVAAIEPYFCQLAIAGSQGASMIRLKAIGLEAEVAMLDATRGVNTHRGAIFGLGLLCAAVGARTHGVVGRQATLGQSVSELWGREIAELPASPSSHGASVVRKFEVGGARMEAACGFPSVYKVGLPALRRARRTPFGKGDAPRVEACFALIEALEDTNLLYRGGSEGLRFAQRMAKQFLDEGGTNRAEWRDFALAVHLCFIARGLSPGGSADLLAMTLFVDVYDKEGSP